MRNIGWRQTAGRGMRLGLSALGLVALTGCEALMPRHPVDSAAVQQRLLQTPVARSAWWTAFGDKTLDSLETQALAQNYDLKIAVQNVIQAREMVNSAQASLLPSLSASGSVTRSALSGDGTWAAVGAPSAPSTLWEAGVAMKWEPDVWGRALDGKHAAEAGSRAAEAEAQGAVLSLTAMVARTYVQYRAAQQAVAIVEENQRVSDRTVHVAQSRAQNGVAGRGDTATALAQQATVAALLPRARERRDALRNALAQLLALPPHGLEKTLAAPGVVPQLRGAAPSGIPSDLARGRPDIVAARAALAAAIDNRKMAAADFYPSITLTGSFGKQAFELHAINQWGSREYAIGPSLYLPIFTGGKLRAQYALATSRQQAAGLNYQKTVLAAWHEIDDAMTAIHDEAERNAQLRIAVTQNREGLRAAERGYEEGTTEYLPQLVAQRDLLASQQALVESAMSEAMAAIDLYRAVGGDWRHAAGQSAGPVGAGG